MISAKKASFTPKEAFFALKARTTDDAYQSVSNHGANVTFFTGITKGEKRRLDAP